MENREVDSLIGQLKDACIDFVKFNDTVFVELTYKHLDDPEVERMIADYRKLADMIITIKRAERQLGRGLPRNSCREEVNSI